ncbi:hypothetical protein ACIQUM_33290 [Amycolatopsis azurea]|uniref:hypothetical protein n=1 Tax=Amycolatopsis azurea TaxID=36819 RepID=UPI003803BC4E
MTVLDVIVTVVVILLTVGVIVILVLGGILYCYIGAAEKQSTRTFTRIHDPDHEPRARPDDTAPDGPPQQPRPLDTDPDGPPGQPFRPIHRGTTSPPIASRHGSDAQSRPLGPRTQKKDH